LHDELQASYESLQQLQDLRENLTHMIVHDLRSPLTAIMGSLEIMPDFGDFTSDETLAELHEMATTNSQQLLHMINDLLDITKMESGQLVISAVPVNLSSTIEEIKATVVPLARTSEVQLEFNVPQEMPHLKADPDLLRRVLVNLLSNAIKFTPARGRVSLNAEKAASNVVRVSVTDTGPGIPPEYHAKIFEKFGQVENKLGRKKLSTGLGLTFCKMAVEAHGGKISLDSVVGQGSIFHLDWPIVSD
jgi:signal transduction histidine kinase